MSSHSLPEPNPELVKYAQQRDANGKPTPEACAAFSLLYECYWPPIYKQFRRSTSEEEAQELAQETFVKAWYALPDKNPNAPFVGWLRTIAFNLSNDYWKKKQRESLRQISLDGLFEEHRTTPEHLTCAGTEEQVILDDIAERAFQRLSRKDQQLLRSRMEGYSEEETAALTEISPSSVPRMLRRARGRFMEYFYQAWHGLTPIRPRRGRA